MNPRSILISDYTYLLPAEKIAVHPLTERDASKLLVYKYNTITSSHYRDIDVFIENNSLLIFNNTKVVEARLLFQKPSGGIIEIFCLEPFHIYADITSGLAQTGTVLWKCMIGGASKWKKGQVLEKLIVRDQQTIILKASYVEKQSDYFVIELSWMPPALSFSEILHMAGIIPLPPYLKREYEISDLERYQTIYAGTDGSVAAPTAGLHFTEAIFEKLQRKNIQQDFVTLHVGAGTFKPVKSKTIEDHHMHVEWIDVSKESIQCLLNFTNNIYAVGTTSLRTLESLYWMGVKSIIDPSISHEDIYITQWEVYDDLQDHAFSFKEAIENLLAWMTKKNLQRIVGNTQILIVPGYSFKSIKGLITNFHQPQSTLLLLIAALAGNDWKKIYDYALNNDFRFLSYGDGCLIENSSGL